jgi:hypothetical protein
MARSSEHLGAKLGPRLARIVTDATLHAKVKSAPHTVRTAMHLQDQFFKLVGHEIGDTLGPTFRMLAEHPDTPAHHANTFRFLADGLGQWQTFLATTVGGQALSVGIGALLTNELEPAISRIIGENPNGLLPIGTVAQLAARRLWDDAETRQDAARQGLDAHRYRHLVRAAQSPPSLDQALLLMRRGVWQAEIVSKVLDDLGYADEYQRGLVNLERADLPPAVLADMVVRGILEEAQASKMAWASGVNDHDFALLVKDTGEAPALQTLLEGYRRGFLDDATLEHGIRTGRLRNEWIPFAKKLRYEPPGPADAIRAAVQGHLPHDAAKRKAEQAGLDPADFEWLFETAGEPISIGQALSLLNRGVMTQPQAEQVVRESRVKTKYVPQVIALRRHILPERTVVAMYRGGALDAAGATRRLLDIGVDADDIHALLTEASHGKSARARELTEAQLVELYTDGALSQAQLTEALAALGYDRHEAAQLVTLADLRRARRLQQSVISVIRSRYVARHIDDGPASSALDAARVTSGERDNLLELWGLERDTTTRLPTVAELTKAFKLGAIDAGTWGQRLLGLGYGEADLPIMAAAHGVG